MASEGDFKKLVEAALFVSAKPMSIEELATFLGVASVGYVANLVKDLSEEYETRDTSLTISKIGDKFLISLKEPYLSKVSSLAGSPDISKPALRILAYISKNNPILQSKLVSIFGSSAYSYIHELQEQEFITTKKIGRTKKIQLTDKFNIYFEIKE
ncbi:MAG: SMC-Scp complex subunit ScpB [Candidatus Micrarchaeia archaeon]